MNTVALSLQSKSYSQITKNIIIIMMHISENCVFIYIHHVHFDALLFSSPFFLRFTLLFIIYHNVLLYLCFVFLI